MGALTVIAEQGGAELAWASLAVLAWAGAGLLGLGLTAAAAAAWRRGARPAAGRCRWCDDPDCIDSDLCTCAVPCPMSLCKALDTIAALCPCCNGARGRDCICTHDCGSPRCQAADPEEARRA